LFLRWDIKSENNHIFLFGIDYERKNRLYFSELQQARRKELLRTSTR
jgi:hypothetical protein